MATTLMHPNLTGHEQYDHVQGAARALPLGLTDAQHTITNITGPARIQPQHFEEDTRWENRLQYPSAMLDRSEVVSSMIMGLLNDKSQDQSFLRRILPTKMTDSMKFTWNKTIFADGTAQIVPEEGVPSVLKFSQTSDFASVQRYMIAIRCEANFSYTAPGRTLMYQQVEQLIKACYEAQDLDTIFTLLMTDGEDYFDQYKKGKIEQDWQTMISMRNNETFCLQKRHGNFEQDMFIKMIDSRKELLRSRGASNPSDLIMCRGAEMYLHGIGQDNSYAVAGPEGPARAKQNMFAPVNTYRGLTVNYTKEYIIQRGMAPRDFLTGPCIAGEFYVLPAKATAIEIYDYTLKKWAVIKRDDIEKAVIKTLAGLDITTTKFEGDTEENTKEDTKEDTEEDTKVTLETVIKSSDLLVCRTFMQFLAGHAIMLQGGAGLGHNYIGSRSNFEWGDNAVDQTKIGTFAFYSKAVVFNKLWITHMKNILCKRYMGGGNTEFMSTIQLQGIQHDQWTPYMTRTDASLFAIPIADSKNIQQHIPLSGKFEGDLDGDDFGYRTLVGLREKLGFIDTVGRHSMVNFFDPNLTNPTNNGLQSPLVVSMGYHRVCDGKVWTHVLGDSVLGNNIYPGCEKVLNGIVPTFKNMEYEKLPHIPTPIVTTTGADVAQTVAQITVNGAAI